MPLYFTANRGQVDGRALFYAKASRYTLWLTEEGLVFDSFKSEMAEAPAGGKRLAAGEVPFPRTELREAQSYARDVSRLVFLNASLHPEIVSVAETAPRVNYFIGNDPEKWHTAVPTSEAVLYKNIYDRIDLKVYGTEGRIEYDWIVRPGGNPKDIKFEYRNVKGTRVDEAGNLLIETSFGELMHKKPEAYQGGVSTLPAEGRSSNNARVAIESAFKKIGENAYGANGGNTGTVSYRIFQIENGQAVAIANVGIGTSEYIVRGVLATKPYRFGVIAVNSQGWESDMVEIAIQ